MQVNRQLIKELILSTNTNNENLQAIKDAVQTEEYIDANGKVWKASSDTPELVLELKFPINLRVTDEAGNRKNSNTEHSRNCCCLNLYYLRKKEYENVVINCTLDNAKIRFTHLHDLRTAVTTCFGKPEDLTKYTKDKARVPKFNI